MVYNKRHKKMSILSNYITFQLPSSINLQNKKKSRLNKENFAGINFRGRPQQ